MREINTKHGLRTELKFKSEDYIRQEYGNEIIYWFRVYRNGSEFPIMSRIWFGVFYNDLERNYQKEKLRNNRKLKLQRLRNNI